MRDVKWSEDSWGIGYEDLIETMEFEEILIDCSDDDYQGETYMLVSKLGQYGVFNYGWGSCSGCDAAQAVSSGTEANELRDDLYHSIRWFDTGAELYEWAETADHDLQWYGHDSAFKTFLRELEAKKDDLLVTEADVEAAKASILGG